MLKNFKLTIEYDGGAFHGWQRQADRRTVQGELEGALEIMTGSRVTLTGSGRTDAGVHARGQVAHFHSGSRLAPAVFQRGLNSLTPDDIVIRSCEAVDPTFHARFDAKSKTYAYRILNRSLPDAIARQYAWHIREKLDADAMDRAASHLVGIHDFKAFEGSGSPRSHTTRRVIKAHLFREQNHHLVFEIEANGFLRFMVRNIVGTLVEVGKHKRTPREFRDLRISKNRTLAGATAPPHGLFLMQVTY